MDRLSKSPDNLNIPIPSEAGNEAARHEEEIAGEAAIELASQWKLTWWKFRRHRLAVAGLIIVITFYVVAICADFFAPQSPSTYIAEYVYAPPQQINLIHDGNFAPY